MKNVDCYRKRRNEKNIALKKQRESNQNCDIIKNFLVEKEQQRQKIQINKPLLIFNNFNSLCSIR